MVARRTMAERSDDLQTATLVFLPGANPASVDAARVVQKRPPGALARYRSIGRGMAVTDAMALVAAAVVAALVHKQTAAGLAIVYPPLQFMVLAGWRLYAPHRLPPSEELRRLILGVTIGVAAITVAAAWLALPIQRSWIALTWALSLALVGASHAGWRRRIGRAQREGSLRLKTIVVGTNDEGRRLARAMTAAPAEGFEPLGFLTVDRQVVDVDGFPVLGSLADIVEAVAESGADCVFVASSAVRVEDVAWLARVLRPQDVEVRFSTNLPELLISRISLQPVGRIPSLTVRRARLTGPQAAMKRAVDVSLSGFLLLVTSPLWAAIALAIRVTSPGPILFRQERIGARGAPFTMFKFRTMVRDAESRRHEVDHLNEATGPLFKIRRDPRVTRVGRFLRRCSLDELPQLVNVIRGEMSLVGPRPPLRSEVSAYERWHFARLEVRPGMTGLGQVTGRSDRSFEDTVRLDVFYIENWSLTYDLWILAKTIPALLSAKGAY
jgi:exopolysaccharide biosynthesis polyprenyl glycosylphosphotransferase